MAKNDDKPETVKSAHELDLERRFSDDYKPDSDRGQTVAVNPNPLGDEEYVGVDPIYQNHANKVDVPLAAKKGAFKSAEEYVKDTHDLDKYDDDEVAEDYGLGGKARKAQTGGPERETYLVPGQEGYPKNPDKLSGPAVRRSAVKDDDDDGTNEQPSEADNPGTNMGASTQPPEPPKNPSDPDKRAGDKTGK